MPKGNQFTTVENSDEHYTPKWFFDQLEITFDLDVASPIGGSHVPCRKYYTKADDGFESEWFGNVFMNPPFSETTKWARKFMQYGNGIAILPASSAYWAKELWESEAGIVLFTRGLKFERPDNGKPKNVSYQLWVVAYGETNIQALRKLGKLR